VPQEYQRTDATAVSAEEYARMARRAQAERQRKSAELVDPRSISGAAYAQGRPPMRRAPSNMVARGSRTRPIPQFQPLPSLGGNGRGRFTMIVGADGRVKDVSVERAITGGNTAAVVGAIQRWRFKPATENGRPIAAPYSVEISFRRE
jgi:TonB family protein